jgi:predicted DNA-binding transcriptional regulator AlpA
VKSPNFNPQEIPRAEIPKWITALAARLLEPEPEEAMPTTDDGDDQWLTAAQVAEALGVSPKHVYRHASKWPFARKVGSRNYRFSAQGLKRWQARQRA